MFTFQVVGVINGLTPSRDGRILYLKVIVHLVGWFFAPERIIPYFQNPD